MRTATFDSETLRSLLRRRTVASMPELRQALGTTSRQTVLRKLQPLDYITSYSHRHRYYALRESAAFDPDGLWTHGPARFSRHGTLLATVEAAVLSAGTGLTARELEALLGVATKDPLRRLVRRQRIARASVDGQFVYCARKRARRRRQLERRRRAAPRLPAPEEPARDAVSQALALFFSLLDERLRRLFAGLESLRHGHGGDARVARRLRLNPATVRRGRRELLAGGLRPGRVRKPGGGRKPLGKKSLPSSPV